MSVNSKVWCGARIPAGKKVTALHLLAGEQVTTWCCFKKMAWTPIMTIDLDKTRRHRISDTHLDYPDCRVKVNTGKIRELEPECLVRLKVKRGDNTIRKKIVNAKDLIHCLHKQENNNVFGEIHVAIDVSSFYPLTVGLKTVVEATADESLQAVSDTIADQPPPPPPPYAIPADFWESLLKDSTREAPTDDQWEDIPLVDSDDDVGQLQQDDGPEGDKYPRQEYYQDISCYKGLGIDEQHITLRQDEAAPLRRRVWLRMWRPVRRVVLLSVLGVLAVTVLMVVLEPMLPDLHDAHL